MIARLDAAEAENARLREALESLTEAPALSGVRDMVAGWNGENLPDGKRYTERHPSRLGAQIKTNCGRIYDLDERITSARAALEKAP